MIKNFHSIVILGASGNLTVTKLMPSLYKLYASNSLPIDFNIIGYARSNNSNEKYRAEVKQYLKKNVKAINYKEKKVDSFLEHTFYCQGQYNNVEDFKKLNQQIVQQTNSYTKNSPILYYLSIPPAVFEDAVLALNQSGSITKGKNSSQTVVIEKPFGYDTSSAKKLNATLTQVFDEEQIYRIDHYLGKEAIQNLMALRFANTIFEPLWNSQYIDCITVSWEEALNVGSRGGYFDQAGIIRDVIQNHLLQILALCAMEKPQTINSTCIQKEKNNILKNVSPIKEKDIILGQYTRGVCLGKEIIGYTEEESVPSQSKRETFAKINCQVNTSRWRGTKFVLRAGKALTKASTEIIITFKDSEKQIFTDGPVPTNKLIIRVQPDASIYFKINNKIPGNGLNLSEVKMNFDYDSSFNKNFPDAYERLLLDAIKRDKTLFISCDELIRSWEIFTPILQKIDANQLPLKYYSAGTIGPDLNNQ